PLARNELEAVRLDLMTGHVLQLPHLRAVPTLPREPLDLTSLMNEIIEDARLEAGAEEKSVDWSSPKEAVIVEGDHGLLRSAIENVRRNAVRFTKPSSAVKVRA